MDTNPLAADPEVIIAQRGEDFVNGLKILTALPMARYISVLRPTPRFPVPISTVSRDIFSPAPIQLVLPEPIFTILTRSMQKNQSGPLAIRM